MNDDQLSTTPNLPVQDDLEAFHRFRRALRRADQEVLDDLYASVKEHLSAASTSDNILAFEALLLSMLLEEHKTIQRLRRLVEDFQAGSE